MDLNKDISILISELEVDWQIEVIEAIKKKISDYPVVDSGEMSRSVRAEKMPDGNISFKMTDYGKFQDQGVNPEGLALYQTPFYFGGRWKGTAEAIKDWSIARNLNPYAVAYVLQFEKGIKPKRFFKSTIEAMYPMLGERIEKLIIDKLDFETKKYTGQ